MNTMMSNEHDARVRALLVGFFSTFGDLEVMKQVEGQLIRLGVPYDIVSYFPRGRLEAVEPHHYTHLAVVCGPFSRHLFSEHEIDLDRFSHCTRIGVNLSMVEDLETYNPLDVLFGRDSNQWSLPDLSFLQQVSRVPVAGLCLARNQGEYGERQLHDHANETLKRLAERHGLAVIELDTEFPVSRNTSDLSSPEHFESICARLDVMLTTRLHGTVLALKNGVPVVALDAITGRAKVTRQAAAIGWPYVFSIDNVTDQALDEALACCLKPEARDQARAAVATARAALAGFPEQFAAALQAKPQGKQIYTPRPPTLRERAKGYMRPVVRPALHLLQPVWGRRGWRKESR